MKSTTEWVVDQAREFIERKGGYSFVQLEKVKEDEKEGVWTVTFDVGVLREELKTVVVEDGTGEVVGFE
ncbi:MAG: hypothetical protein KAU99_03795 [Thermoplasmata archaeon]|nr:hypothetical protein [Thermoplasmata archaeon]